MDTTKLAIKTDIKDLKSDIQRLEQSTKTDIKDLKSDIQRLEQSTKTDIKALKDDIKELREDNQKLDTKLDKLQNTLDGFVGTVDDLRTDNTVGTHHTRELQIKVDDHEQRIKDLESPTGSL